MPFALQQAELLPLAFPFNLLLGLLATLVSLALQQAELLRLDLLVILLHLHSYLMLGVQLESREAYVDLERRRMELEEHRQEREAERDWEFMCFMGKMGQMMSKVGKASIYSMLVPSLHIAIATRLSTDTEARTVLE